MPGVMALAIPCARRNPDGTATAGSGRTMAILPGNRFLPGGGFQLCGRGNRAAEMGWVNGAGPARTPEER